MLFANQVVSKVKLNLIIESDDVEGGICYPLAPMICEEPLGHFFRNHAIEFGKSDTEGITLIIKPREEQITDAFNPIDFEDAHSIVDSDGDVEYMYLNEEEMSDLNINLASTADDSPRQNQQSAMKKFFNAKKMMDQDLDDLDFEIHATNTTDEGGKKKPAIVRKKKIVVKKQLGDGTYKHAVHDADDLGEIRAMTTQHQ